VTTVESKPGLIRFSIEANQEMVEDLKVGASVAVNGVCLTVASIHPEQERRIRLSPVRVGLFARLRVETITFDVMNETLKLTTLGSIKIGDQVNIERSLKVGDEVGGHIVSGHVHGVAKIVDITKTENNVDVTLEPPAELAKYIFPKGFVALNGVSLTVVHVSPLPGGLGGRISVSLIPETLRATTFGAAKIGDLANLEVDQQTRTIVDTITLLLRKGGS